MKTLLRSFAALGLCCACVASEPRPNVLVLLADDQRADTIGALGNPHIRTPNLDQLAERSFVFRHAYCFGGNTAAVCIPARNELMSGSVFFRYGPGNHLGGGTPYAPAGGPTLPKAFAAAGYETYYSEKSGEQNLPDIQKQFDHVQNVHQVDALRTGRPLRRMVDDAIDFLQRREPEARPFFMYLGFPAPHDPRWSARAFRALYREEDLPVPPNFLPLHPFDKGDLVVRDECLEAWPRTPEAIRRHLRDYYALISSMDHDVGRLLAALDERGLRDQTVIVFTSDQGVSLGSHGLMGKQSLYEEAMRVPLLISGPGIPHGASDAFAYLHDLLPTLCDLAGSPRPEGIDGRSLAPTLRGEARAVRDQVFLAYSTHQRALREGRWKLIRTPRVDVTQLFDLDADPHETVDLASDPAHAATVARLMAALEAEQAVYGDTLPLRVDRPDDPAWTPPAVRPMTPYPAGGPAPDEDPDPAP